MRDKAALEIFFDTRKLRSQQKVSKKKALEGLSTKVAR
jgi:hypothetical protein